LERGDGAFAICFSKTGISYQVLVHHSTLEVRPHIFKNVSQTQLEHQQAWGNAHFPEELVPMLDHHLSKELFSDIQSELPLMQL